MEFEAKKYIKDAVLIIKGNISPIIILLIINLSLYIPIISNTLSNAVLFLPVIIIFIVYPLICGQYVEIILNNKKASYLKIFNEHWFNFFVVNFLIGCPVLIILLLSILVHDSIGIIKNPVSIAISTLALYVFPLVFLLKKRLESISLGFKCLFGNLAFSLPLLIISLIPTIFSNAVGVAVKNTGATVEIVFGILFMFFNTIIDFSIFIAAVLILRNKLFVTEVF
jgi:hypothetical protein